ncbi:hypothetical protein [Streptomyces parvulus]|uniref:hypothetical protein n=1 Tax=Streptomyces parvulus TaxID=146923 RepID=UPI0037A25FEF
MIHIAHQAALAHKDEAWFSGSGGREAAKRLRELAPLVRDEGIASDLGSVDSYYFLTARAVTRDDMSATQVAEIVQDQREMAKTLKLRAERALAAVQRLS